MGPGKSSLFREQWELSEKEPMAAANDVMVGFRGTCRESP